MATLQAASILTGSPESAKYNATGDTTQIWSVATTTALANGDIINGPVIPAGNYLTDISVGATKMDNGAALLFTCGYTGQTAAFVTSSNAGQAGGIARMNAVGSLGFVATTDTRILITITGTAAAPVAGTFVICVTYTASP